VISLIDMPPIRLAEGGLTWVDWAYTPHLISLIDMPPIRLAEGGLTWVDWVTGTDASTYHEFTAHPRPFKDELGGSDVIFH
ncbi:hypothetical protein, partial [Cupriavidus sp. CuC1]|uniref:hypothetical protein n=1 Tax=Cupriavidus sp. CuC1 TaxID=3373131 RepID=UPI0037CDC86B